MAYTQEQFIGAGNLNIDVYDSAGNKTGELDVGNAISFAINAPAVEKKERKGFRLDNYAKTIKSVITKVEQDLKFTLTDINRKNLALAMFGVDADYTQTAGNNTAAAEAVVAIEDKWVKLVSRSLDPATPPVVKDVTDITTYTEGTDYEIDYRVGRIKVLSGGVIAGGVTIHVGSTWLAITAGYKVDGLEVSKIEAYIRLIGQDKANSRDCEVIVYKAQIEPAGDLNWLSEDYVDLEFTGKILDTTDGNWDVLFY
jgi:hypothetical protein